MKIPYEALVDLVPNYENLDILYQEPENDIDLIQNFLPNRLWRLNNLYTIADKDGNAIPFEMNEAQFRVFSAYLRHPRLIILKSRQQGISTLWLIFLIDMALFYDNFNLGLMAQGLQEAAVLLKRVKLAWDKFPANLKEFLGLKLIVDNKQEIGWNNGATVYISTSFRSATLQALHISEFGKIANENPSRAEETKTGSMQAIKPGLPIIIESTAEGMHNEFYKMWSKAEAHVGPYTGKDFMPIFLSWTGDSTCSLDIDQPITNEAEEYFENLEAELGITLTKQQKNWWIAQKRELGDLIYQEYPGTPAEAFMASKDGTYYAKLYKAHVIANNRVVEGLYDPNLAVTVTMDLGMNDTMVLGFWQYYDDQERLIDEYHNSGEGLEHYVNIMSTRGYDIEEVIGPHDLNVRELTNRAQTRAQKLRELGVRKLTVLPKASIQEGIEAVRGMIPTLWIDAKCDYISRMFLAYTKQWDSKLGVFKDNPLHDEWSNPADMVRYRAMSKRRKSGDSKRKMPERARQRRSGNRFDL